MGEMEAKLVNALGLLEQKLAEIQELGRVLKQHGQETVEQAERQRAEITALKALIARQRQEQNGEKSGK